MKKALLIGNIIAGVFAANVWAGDMIGSVDTGFKLFGKNNKIEVSAFDDPKVKGVTCYISRPIQGGITGSLGLSEERSDTGIAAAGAAGADHGGNAHDSGHLLLTGSRNQRGDGPGVAPAVAVEHRQGPQVHRVVAHGPGHLVAQ